MSEYAQKLQYAVEAVRVKDVVAAAFVGRAADGIGPLVTVVPDPDPDRHTTVSLFIDVAVKAESGMEFATFDHRTSQVVQWRTANVAFSALEIDALSYAALRARVRNVVADMIAAMAAVDPWAGKKPGADPMPEELSAAPRPAEDLVDGPEA